MNIYAYVCRPLVWLCAPEVYTITGNHMVISRNYHRAVRRPTSVLNNSVKLLPTRPLRHSSFSEIIPTLHVAIRLKAF